MRGFVISADRTAKNFCLGVCNDKNEVPLLSAMRRLFSNLDLMMALFIHDLIFLLRQVWRIQLQPLSQVARKHL